MFKKILSIVVVTGLLGVIGISTIRANTYQIDDSVTSEYSSTAHFNQNGNDFDGMFFREGDIATSGETISFSGSTKTCMKQLKGYYFNNQRGARVRPLDSESLTSLRATNASYNDLTLTGGLRRDCDGESQWNVYGQVTHTYAGQDYKLLAGVEFDLAGNIYLANFAESFQYKNILNKYAANGRVFDTRGGISQLVSNVTLTEGNASLTGVVASGTVYDLTGTVVVANADLTGYVEFDVDVDIEVGTSDWNGTIVPPTAVAGSFAAVIGEPGMATGGTVRATIQAGATGTSLIASGGNFIVSFFVTGGDVAETLNIYRSQDGDNWMSNTPQSVCILDADKMCRFLTDHLTYFGVVSGDESSDPIVDDEDDDDDQGRSGGGSYRLKKDNCPDGDDSPSYYDRTCEGDDDYFSSRDDHYSTVRLGSIANSPYSREMDQAYLYGYNNILTLAPTVQEAGMKDTMNRKNLAIMMASYATRVLGLSPDPDKKGCNDFKDIGHLDADTQLFLGLSCQLGLMGVDTEGNAKKYFEPNKIVTRAHFATIFSRLLFGDQYNGGTPYYEKHFAGLNTHGIIKSEQYPAMLERRGYILLMMLRADTEDVGRAIYHASPAEYGADALFDSLK